MSYLPAGLPLPQASPEDAPFWAACRERRLLIRHCRDCGQFFHPPMPSCGHCGSTEVDWQPVAGSGTVFSWTVAHHAVHPALKGHGPYNICVVLLDGAGDVRLVSNVVDAAPGELHIGMPVDLFWDEVEDGQLLPRFKRAATQGARP